jgi:tetratricopeptide (TPR) repeat protein
MKKAAMIGLALILVVSPAWAQGSKEAIEGCANQSISDDARIGFCTQLIEKGDLSKEALPSVYLSRAASYEGKGLYDKAIADLSKIIELKPHDPYGYGVYAYGARGLAYGVKGLYDKAIADFSKSIELRPDDAYAYSNRAWAYHLKGEDAKGLPDVEKAIELAPKDVAAIETRAEIEEKLGQKDKAIADYRAAIKIDPKQKDALDGLKRLGAAP